MRALIDPGIYAHGVEQLSLFTQTPGGPALPAPGDAVTVVQAAQEAVACLARAM